MLLIWHFLDCYTKWIDILIQMNVVPPPPNYNVIEVHEQLKIHIKKDVFIMLNAHKMQKKKKKIMHIAIFSLEYQN